MWALLESLPKKSDYLGGKGMIQFLVNGQEVQVEETPSRSLLFILRQELGLMGTKDGCSQGHCGTCTVIVDGKARRSCLIPVERLAGKKIRTIESLEQKEGLHPLQEAFLQAGAIQCGFCTPGMIMAAKALLDKNPDPTDEEIRQALRHNLCRCTGYLPIIQAVKMAAQNADLTAPLIQKGGRDRALGRPLYTADYRREGMYYGRLLLSPVSHAWIQGLDVSRAQKIPGVLVVLVAQDIPGRKTFGLLTPHQPVLAWDRIRYQGEPLALVIARDPLLAARARDQIRFHLHPLPPLFSIQEARKDHSPSLHPGGNQMKELTIRRGQVEVAMAQSHLVVENTYTTPLVEHGYLEPEAALSYPDGKGGVVVETGSQSAFAMQEMIAASLNLPEARVRVITRPPGGAFGGKEEPTVQIHAALGALRLGAPVLMTVSREESLLLSTKRHGMTMHYRTGVLADGRLLATEVDIQADTGAYASLGPAVLTRAAAFSCGPYRVPHVLVKAAAYYTNHPPAGAMRGFGSPQVAFAIESQMNRISELLGIDPVTIRERNALTEGEETITGQVLGPGTGLQSILQILRREWDKIEEQPTVGKKQGQGVALAYKNVGLGGGVQEEAGAVLELGEGGRIHLRVGAVDMGQGLSHTLATLAGKVLHLSPSSFVVICSDTHQTPDAGVTTASRQTFLSGNAVLKASERFREELFQVVGTLFSLPPHRMEGGWELCCDGEKLVTLDRLYTILAQKGETLQAQASYQAPPTTPFGDGQSPFLHYAYCFGAQLVILSVLEETGQIQLEKVVAIHDLGKALNPQAARGQITGGVMMGLGYALGEEYREGSTSLKEQGILPITQTPAIEVILVEEAQPEGPLGAKGMAELPVSPTAPAVTGAIFAATRQWIRSLPVRKIPLQ